MNTSADRISSSVEKQTQAAHTISTNVGEASKGVGDIARSIAEVAKAANDISRSVAEAARARTMFPTTWASRPRPRRGISSSIITVVRPRGPPTLSATSVNTAADALDRVAKELQKLVGRFRLQPMDPEPLRILVVDDSRIFRVAVQARSRDGADMRVVGSVWSGEKAVEFVRDSPPDLVTLDLNMPGRGGLETLSDIQDFNASRPDLPAVGVLLFSALTERGAAITIEGLERGAFDFIRKPDGPDEQANAALSATTVAREDRSLRTATRTAVGQAVATTVPTVVASPMPRDRPVPRGRHRRIDGRPRSPGPLASRLDEANLRPPVHRATPAPRHDAVLRGEPGEESANTGLSKPPTARPSNLAPPISLPEGGI